MQIRKGYIDTKGGQVHYRYCGSVEHPPVAMFHMIATSSVCYEKIMKLLGNDYRVIALDIPGFGESFIPSVSPSIPYYASILLEALAGLGIQSFHAFGHHTGAAIAAQMAADAPERIQSLMMEGPIWLTAEEAKSFHEQFVRPVPVEDDGSHLSYIWNHVSSLDPDHPPELCHRETTHMLKALHGFHEAFAAVFAQDYDAVFARVSCPMLVLIGENDLLMPYFDRFEKAFPQAKSVVLPGCGVYALDNCAERNAQEIREFLSTL